MSKMTVDEQLNQITGLMSKREKELAAYFVLEKVCDELDVVMSAASYLLLTGDEEFISRACRTMTGIAGDESKKTYSEESFLKSQRYELSSECLSMILPKQKVHFGDDLMDRIFKGYSHYRSFQVSVDNPTQESDAAIDEALAECLEQCKKIKENSYVSK